MLFPFTPWACVFLFYYLPSRCKHLAHKLCFTWSVRLREAGEDTLTRLIVSEMNVLSTGHCLLNFSVSLGLLSELDHRSRGSSSSGYKRHDVTSSLPLFSLCVSLEPPVKKVTEALFEDSKNCVKSASLHSSLHVSLCLSCSLFLSVCGCVRMLFAFFTLFLSLFLPFLHTVCVSRFTTQVAVALAQVLTGKSTSTLVSWCFCSSSLFPLLPPPLLLLLLPFTSLFSLFSPINNVTLCCADRPL